MLYDLWRHVRDAQPDALALRELATGRSWTFSQLDAAAQHETAAAPIVFPQGNDAAFVISVLRAWRHGQLLCPLDLGQTAPAIDPAALLSRHPDAVHLKTTSASTGSARVVVFNAAQLAADAAQIVSTMDLRADWPNVGVISLAHSYGFSNLVLPLLLHGIPLLLAESQLPESFRRAASTFPQMTVAAVPALWRAWHDGNAIPPNVQLAISAGAPLPLPLEHDIFQKRGLKIHNFYGASECGGIAYDRTATPRSDATCVGSPMDAVQLTLNSAGCLEVRGANVGCGYWPEADDALSGGTFRTSDLAELRDRGVFLRGRASDLINVAGRKLSPETVERALLQHPAVRACLVLGVPGPDDTRSETIAAVVATTGSERAEDFRQFLLTKLPAWQVPREWRLVESLEVNARGKLSRAEWRRRWGSSKGVL
jgi:acyl-CoA synthetase (AMP-forming)/AMP-acid ligase II